MKNIYKTIQKTILGMALVSSTLASAQSYNNVTSWVGTGTDSTIAVVDFLEEGGDFSWGVRFNDSITGSEILDLIESSDPNFKVQKSAFLTSIDYGKFNTDKPGVYWGTWTKSNNSWVSNTGIGDKVGSKEFFGFTYTDFNPALPPYGVSYKGVDFWVGTGKDSALAIVDYLEKDASYIWGVRFDDSITGSEILDLISWNDKDFYVDKGAFLNSIDYKSHKSDKKGTYWGTWSKTGNKWYLNTGIGQKIGNDNVFGFSYTDFNPAVAPTRYATPALKSYFTIDNAIHKDSSVFTIFASNVVDFQRGFKDIATPNSGYVTHGDSTNALGKINNQVVSLGDNGSITLSIDPQHVITDASGPDFAIFENGFSKDFLELAFVEVSSDGVNFVRFPAISIVQSNTQVGGFGNTEAKNIHNLAGKYKSNYGTPFDLADLADSSGLNINAISHIKIVDVVGSINPTYGTKDSKGHIINDPYATSFASGGFDLDGIGVINYTLLSPTFEKANENNVLVYPTQTSSFFTVQSDDEIEEITIINSGTGITQSIDIVDNKVDISQFSNGAYILNISTSKGNFVQKVIKY